MDKAWGINLNTPYFEKNYLIKLYIKVWRQCRGIVFLMRKDNKLVIQMF